jgi:hypothetical protein
MKEPVSIELDLSQKYIRDLKTNKVHKIKRFDTSDNTALANDIWYALDWRSFADTSSDCIDSAQLVESIGVVKYSIVNFLHLGIAENWYFGEQCDHT